MSGHPQNFQSLAGRSAGFWVLLVTLGVIVAGGGITRREALKALHAARHGGLKARNR